MFRYVGSLALLSLLAACGTSPVESGVQGEPGTVIDSDGGVNGGGNLDSGSTSDGGGEPLDAGIVPDASGSDASEDDTTISFDVGSDSTAPDAVTDTGPQPDVIGPPDVVDGCVPGTATCEAGLLLLCADDGGLVRRRCDPGTECRVQADGNAACEPIGGPDVCEALDVRCDPSGRGIQQCSEDGAGWLLVQECPFGCDVEDVECLAEDDVVVPGSCDDPDIEIVAPGEFQIDLCELDDTTDLISGGACSSGDSGEGSDFTFGFTLDRRARVLFEAWDDDPNAPIDTIIALRTACTAEESQIACHDDLACGDSDIFPSNSCSGDVQVRHSRITRELEPGTYYGVVDHFDYRTGAGTFGCGIVRVVLDVTPL